MMRDPILRLRGNRGETFEELVVGKSHHLRTRQRATHKLDVSFRFGRTLSDQVVGVARHD